MMAKLLTVTFIHLYIFLLLSLVERSLKEVKKIHVNVNETDLSSSSDVENTEVTIHLLGSGPCNEMLQVSMSSYLSQIKYNKFFQQKISIL